MREAIDSNTKYQRWYMKGSREQNAAAIAAIVQLHLILSHGNSI